jgi:predicted kinase
VHVVVSGPPASGKSTLAVALAAELCRPLVAKDTIKEALLAELGAPDVAASRRLGRASVVVLLAVARQCPGAVLECNWHRSECVDDLRALGPLVEVYCRVDRAVLEARFLARAPTRHAGHFDAGRRLDEVFSPETAEPVAGGWPVIEIRTDRPVDVPAVGLQVRRLGGRGVDQ